MKATPRTCDAAYALGVREREQTCDHGPDEDPGEEQHEGDRPSVFGRSDEQCGAEAKDSRRPDREQEVGPVTRPSSYVGKTVHRFQVAESVEGSRLRRKMVQELTGREQHPVLGDTDRRSHRAVQELELQRVEPMANDDKSGHESHRAERDLQERPQVLSVAPHDGNERDQRYHGHDAVGPPVPVATGGHRRARLAKAA